MLETKVKYSPGKCIFSSHLTALIHLMYKMRAWILRDSKYFQDGMEHHKSTTQSLCILNFKITTSHCFQNIILNFLFSNVLAACLCSLLHKACFSEAVLWEWVSRDELESERNPGKVKSLLLNLSEHLAQKFPGIVTEKKMQCVLKKHQSFINIFDLYCTFVLWQLLF